MSTPDITPPPASQAFYTDIDEEYRASREGAVVYDHADADVLEMTGADCVRFLNGQITCDVEALEPGKSAYGFFTTARGRIESDVSVLRREDGFRMVLPPGLGPAILERLRKYIIADRVEIQEGGVAPISLVGPEAEKVHGRCVDEASQSPVTVPRDTVPQADGGYDIWPKDEEEKHRVWDALLAAGASAMGSDAWERRRIEDGVPRFEVDFGLDHFPQETGLEEAVSYTKGCYLGQEVVARIHYRGGVQRRLRGLDVESVADAAQLTGTEIQLDGKAVGRLGSAVDTERGVLGLAILHDKATVGSTVALMLGSGRLGSARVVELPF